MIVLERGQQITAQEVDLAKPLGQGGGDRITGYETPEKWGINLPQYL